jgi:ATP-dependent Lhr-like helicase
MASMSGEPSEMEFLTPTATAATAVAALAEAVRAWFRERFGDPTAIQRTAWPAVAAGRHVLISAPTGTGKTLAAFLPLLSKLVTEPPAASPWSCGPALAGLYVSPLKALANDICCNLTRYLDEIAAELPPDAPRRRVAVRTGDTSAEERRAQVDDPPDLLLTTPESLAILLSQPERQSLFAGLRWIIVDEIHALAATKRGADLAISLERLSAISRHPVQRLGLSATATPLAEAAAFLVGVRRPCAIAVVRDATLLRLTIAPLERTTALVPHLAERLELELRAHRSTLIFTNTRGLAERLSWSLRRRMPDWDARIAVHHSSLAAGRRREVERAFKAGRLGAVASSTSLELGIDIGSVDLVVLVHPPGDVVRLLQRVGRAGHGPGRVRRGLVLTDSASELLEAAVTAASGTAGQCEPLSVDAAPLDVLCQQLLGMACAGACCADEVYELVRCSYPFRDLARTDFDDCLSYLFGRDRDGGDWLRSRLIGDSQAFTVCDEGTAKLLRRNLGTILAEETATVVIADCELRFADTAQSAIRNPQFAIGTVDLAFAERLQPGDRFLLDGRCLEVRQVAGNEVYVDDANGRPAVPRWGGDGWPLSPQLAQRLFALRVLAAEALRESPIALATLLRREYGLDGRAVEVLVDYFEEQESVSEIPDGAVCLVEAVATGYGETYYVHTPLNRRGNDALARVAVRRLAREHGRSALTILADLGFAIIPRGGPLGRPDTDVAGLVRRLLDATGFESDLDAALADSESLRHQFQRVAVTGLMLLRNPIGRKRRVGGRDWAQRRLFDQVRARDPDFVLLRQTRREVRASACDSDAAFAYARSLPALAVRCRWLANPSPFARAWTQEEVGAMESVETPAQALERLHAHLFDPTRSASA